MTDTFKRVRSIRAIDCGEVTTLLGRDGSARELRGGSALLVRELLHILNTPLTFEHILSHLDQVAPGASNVRGTIEQALEHLIAAGAVERVVKAAPAPERASGRLVLGISGAIAAAYSPELVGRLLHRGYSVRVAMTPSAQRFVSPRALRALTHHRVYRSMWSGTANAPAPHIALADWAQMVLVAPASATTVARLAGGDCSTLVSALALSTHAPVLVAPSMNPAMHDAPAIARNLSQLAEDGFHLLHPSSGQEVADAPADRQPTFGSWPSPEDTVAIVDHLWLRTRQRARSVVSRDQSLATWEAVYEGIPAFHSDQLDPDVLEILQQVKRPATLWDIGTGLGTVAREAARLGFTATGSDLSPRAIGRASEGPALSGLRFVVDDIRQSQIDGTFDVVIDRGCLHTLSTSEARSLAAAVRERTHPGSLVLLKIHQAAEPRDWHTLRYRLPDLEALFGPSFEVLRWTASTLPGSQGPAPRAWLAVLQRQADDTC